MVGALGEARDLRLRTRSRLHHDRASQSTLLPATCPSLRRLQAAFTAGIRLPICIFPLPCLYLAPVIISWSCGVTVPVAILKVWGGVGADRGL